MREIRTYGSMSGGWKRGRGATAPAFDSTRKSATAADVTPLKQLPLVAELCVSRPAFARTPGTK